MFLGRTDADLCPVGAVLDYMVRRGSGQGPFFLFSDGRFLSREWFVSSVRSALQAAGVEASDYAGQSFCIGAATTAALCGVQDSLIKTLGRWESSAWVQAQREPRPVECPHSRLHTNLKSSQLSSISQLKYCHPISLLCL